MVLSLQVVAAAAIPSVVTITELLRRRFGRAPTFPTYYRDWQQETDAAPSQELFRDRLKAYHATWRILTKNTYHWLLLVGLTGLILTGRGTGSFQILSTPIPADATRVVVVAVMAFLWMQFGWTLRRLIFERMTLWKMADRLEGPLSERHRLVQLSSLRPMLQGCGFLDIWFESFLPDFTLRIVGEGKVNWFLNKFALVASAIAIGLTHASAFVLIWDAETLWGNTLSLVSFLRAAQVVTAVLIVLCYLYFVIEGHGGWFFTVCAWAAAIWIMVLPKMTVLRPVDWNPTFGASAQARGSVRASAPRSSLAANSRFGAAWIDRDLLANEVFVAAADACIRACPTAAIQLQAPDRAQR